MITLINNWFVLSGLQGVCFCLIFFFSKQKAAYELGISGWSSDVCSSDLRARLGEGAAPGPSAARRSATRRLAPPAQARASLGLPLVGEAPGAAVRPAGPRKRIGLGKASRTSLCEVDAPRRGADHPANAACNGRGTVTMSRNIDINARSEERRVGKERVSTCRDRWA